MSLRRPTATVTIDGRALTAPEAALVQLRVELGLGSAHDRCVLRLQPLSPFANVSTGAEVAVAVGYGDDPLDVFTGTVLSVERSATGIAIEAIAASYALSLTRVAQAYVGQTAADVANDLLSQAGVTVGEVEAPLALAAFHVDERRPAWSHLQRLARLAGAEIASAADGAVSLRPPKSGAAEHTLRHGAELLAWSRLACADGSPACEVVPFGAASEEGAAKWHLLLKEPDGGAPSAPTVVPGAIRDRDAAKAHAEALTAAVARRTLAGTVLATGDAEIRPGAIVELSGLPTGGDGDARVLAVVHHLDGGGFLTALRLGGVA